MLRRGGHPSRGSRFGDRERGRLRLLGPTGHQDRIAPAGSAEWINPARAALAIRSLGSDSVFELRAPKRGKRLGWTEDDGQPTTVQKKWNPYGGPHGIRQDLFGIIDILALDPQRGVVGVQSTGQDFAGHLRKLTEEKAQECLDWLTTPGTALEPLEAAARESLRWPGC